MAIRDGEGQRQCGRDIPSQRVALIAHCRGRIVYFRQLGNVGRLPIPDEHSHRRIVGSIWNALPALGVAVGALLSR